ncbi:EF-hand domain-containing protein [Nonomuraea sp. MTCD27]|uniref:EF-hand domain-containing protein n=1 Tax=Nonomuraea sp. MTCD27 TaxID=1676747 RepID=UPI0035C15B9C
MSGADSDVINAKCDKFFAVFDVNGNGYIERQDIDLLKANVLKAGSVPPESAKAQTFNHEYDVLWRALVEAVDKDGDGRLSREEFRQALGGLHAAGMRDALYRAAAAVHVAVDTDDDGVFRVEDLVHLYTTCGVPLDIAQSVAAGMDRNGDGTITTAEYATAWTEYFTLDNDLDSRTYGPVL